VGVCNQDSVGKSAVDRDHGQIERSEGGGGQVGQSIAQLKKKGKHGLEVTKGRGKGGVLVG